MLRQQQGSWCVWTRVGGEPWLWTSSQRVSTAAALGNEGSFSVCMSVCVLPRHVWDLISPTRDRTCAPCIGSTGLPGKLCCITWDVLFSVHWSLFIPHRCQYEMFSFLKSFLLWKILNMYKYRQNSKMNTYISIIRVQELLTLAGLILSILCTYFLSP